MQLILPFNQLSKTDAAIAGGKGASLGEMTRFFASQKFGQAQAYHNPVPPGFVILALTFEKFLEATDLIQEIDAILDTVKHEEIHTVEHASEKIQALILSAQMPSDIATAILSSFSSLRSASGRRSNPEEGSIPHPKAQPSDAAAFYVAVRSSATAEDGASAAWAGQLDTFLNTTEETLLVNVQKCWASLFTPRAIFYRFEKGLHGTKISVAVVVQKMVQSEVAGIAFSVHPVTEDRNQLIIEAGFGLGEAVVSGQITPDSYVVEKDPRRIIDKNISDQTRGLYRVGPEHSLGSQASAKQGQEAWLPSESHSTATRDSFSPRSFLGSSGGATSVDLEKTESRGANTWRELGERGKQQKLSDDQILELSELILKIEKHYGFPCDIEWALEACPNAEGGRSETFYITQSRPITTLSSSASQKPLVALDIVFTREYSLMLALIRSEAGRAKRLELAGFDPDRCLISEGDPGKIKFWYSKDEFWNLLSIVAQKFVADNVLFEKLISDYFASYIKLLPYFTRDSHVVTLDEFSWLYHQIFLWRGLADFINDIHRSKYTSDVVKKRAIEVREQTQHYYDEFDNLYKEFFATQSYLKDSADLQQVVTFEEFIALAHKELTTQQIGEIQKRRLGYVLANGTIYLKDELEYALSDIGCYIKHENREVGEVVISRELVGVAASPGRAQGKVRILHYRAQMAEFQRGEVLVTEMTTPDYISAMKKAAAVVTEEGGIMSHAAIISRELGIPCVTGTKIATQVLKDGDLVEVDADAGIVRILERK